MVQLHKGAHSAGPGTWVPWEHEPIVRLWCSGPGGFPFPLDSQPMATKIMSAPTLSKIAGSTHVLDFKGKVWFLDYQ